MPYQVKKSIDIDFGHHVARHRGACINWHGHTWKFEVELMAKRLDETGFVVDFKELKSKVLQPCHDLLDHSLAFNEGMLHRVRLGLELIASEAIATRGKDVGEATPGITGTLCGAYTQHVAGMKIAVFPFIPTSERLAEWLWRVTNSQLCQHTNGRVLCCQTSVYETLHPVESVASYWMGPDDQVEEDRTADD